MGILRKQDDGCLIRVEDILDVEAQRGITYADYIFDESDNETEVETPKKELTNFLIDVSCRQRCKRDVRRCYRLSKLEKSLLASDGLKERKNMGANKLRRIENARMLLNFADPQDIHYDGSDLVSETITAFSRLLSDEHNMKIWNEFIELDEADQRQILEHIDEMSRSTAKSTKNVDVEPSGNGNRADALRAHHPAFSAQLCYDRLDKRYRKCLMKNHSLPLEFMAKTEDQLRSFFASAPQGVYVEALMSKMKRFYFYAMAQFLTLTSTTFKDDSHQMKIIHVTNGESHFTPPSQFLVDFIRERRRRANKTVS